MAMQASNIQKQFTGTIRRINEGPLYSEVEVNTIGGVLTSVLATYLLKFLKLQAGQHINIGFPERGQHH